MNAKQLREYLETLDDETEVRFMSQPSWPFEYSVQGVWRPGPVEYECSAARDGYCETHDADWPTGEDQCTGSFGSSSFEPEGKSPLEVVYLVEGSQLAYGTKQAFEEVETLY